MSFFLEDFKQAAETRRVLDDPILFSKEILGVELWSKQREILGALWDGNDVDVQSCQRGRKDEGRCGGYARVGGSSGRDRAPHPDAVVGSGLGTSSDLVWTSTRVCQERPHPTEHDRPALPACHIPAERGAGEVRLHPASSEKLSPVAARSHGATGTVQAVVLARRAP